jgi:hypothetical protein
MDQRGSIIADWQLGANQPKERTRSSRRVSEEGWILYKIIKWTTQENAWQRLDIVLLGFKQSFPFLLVFRLGILVNQIDAVISSV